MAKSVSKAKQEAFPEYWVDLRAFYLHWGLIFRACVLCISMNEF